MRVLAMLALGLAGALTPADLAEAARQWRGRVVDAQTGQPLEGVVVLAYWIRYAPSLGGWAGGHFVGSEETVTGTDGRFVVPLRRTYTIPLITKVGGPEIVIFKPGYGQWRVRQSAETDGEDLVEIPALRTRDDRLTFHDRVIWSHLIPADRMQNLRRAWDEDRAFLGLRR